MGLVIKGNNLMQSIDKAKSELKVLEEQHRKFKKINKIEIIRF